MPTEYSTVIDIINEKEKVSLKNVVQMLRKKEEEINLNAGTKTRGIALAAQAGSEKRRCHHCGKPGHMWRQCFEYLATEEGKKFLQDHPQWANSRPKGKNSQGTRFGINLARENDAEEPEVETVSGYAAVATTATESWIVDSGASRHVCKDRGSFEDDMRPAASIIMTASGKPLRAKEQGTVRLTVSLQGKTKQILLRNVLHIPECQVNLLSVAEVAKGGFDIIVRRGGLQFVNGTNVIATAGEKGGTYYLDTPIAGIAMPALELPQAYREQLWHRRLGHLGETPSQRIGSMVTGLEGQRILGKPCETCEVSKANRQVSRVPMRPTTRRLERVYVDIWGPAPTESLGGTRYMGIIVDAYTVRKKVIFSATRDGFFGAFYVWQIGAERETGERLAAVHSDKAKELIDGRMREHCAEFGIAIEHTAGYWPESNGVAERALRSVTEKGKALLLEQELEERFWAEAFSHATFLLNVSPTRSMQETPEEAWTKIKPDIQFLRVWGSPCWVHRPKEVRSKLEPKAWKGVFLGFQGSTRLYRIWNPAVGRIEIARSVRFDERTLETRRQQEKDIREGDLHLERQLVEESDDEEEERNLGTGGDTENAPGAHARDVYGGDTENEPGARRKGKELEPRRPSAPAAEQERSEDAEGSAGPSGQRAGAEQQAAVPQGRRKPRETKVQREERLARENAERREREAAQGHRRSQRTGTGKGRIHGAAVLQLSGDARGRVDEAYFGVSVAGTYQEDGYAKPGEREQGLEAHLLN